MSNEILSLETAEPISMFSSLKAGLKAFADNFVPFLKMCRFPVLNIVSMLLMFSPLFAIKTKLGFGGFIFGGILFIVGLVLFFTSFWKSLLGVVAVSYFAKDIYENKPVQEPSKYFSYVEKYSFEYLKFNLWLLLFGIIFVILYFIAVAAIVAFSVIPYMSLIGMCAGVIISVLFFGTSMYGLMFAYIFWAYGDKNDNISIIKNAVLTSAKNVFSVFVLFFILTSIIPAVIYFVCLIPVGIILGLESIKTASSVLSMLLMWFIYYFAMFVSTRYYFAVIKKK